MEWQVLGSPALACPDLVNYATGDSNLTSPGLISRPFLSRIALGRHRLALSPSPRSPALPGPLLPAVIPLYPRRFVLVLFYW